MTRDIAEGLRDGYACWELAIACMREAGVRRKAFKPRDENERRQASEGPVPPAQLAAVVERP